MVDRAIESLLDVQGDSTAHFGDTSAYSHGIATYALAECLAISGDTRLREPVQRAVTWILANQDTSRDRRNRGGWGYFSGTRSPEDGYARTSVTVWQVMALESSKLSGIAVDDEVLAAARTFLRSMFDSRRGSFRYNHEPGRLNSNWPTLPASTPGAVFSLLLLGDDVDDARVQAGLRYTLERRPRAWRDASDDAFVLRAEGYSYFWYCGTLACFLAGGDAWREWNDALKAVFLPAQNADGSFTPIGVYSEDAGDRPDHAAFTTALAVLSLEVYYRYVTPLLTPRWIDAARAGRPRGHCTRMRATTGAVSKAFASPSASAPIAASTRTSIRSPGRAAGPSAKGSRSRGPVGRSGGVSFVEVSPTTTWMRPAATSAASSVPSAAMGLALPSKTTRLASSARSNCASGGSSAAVPASPTTSAARGAASATVTSSISSLGRTPAAVPPPPPPPQAARTPRQKQGIALERARIAAERG